MIEDLRPKLEMAAPLAEIEFVELPQDMLGDLEGVTVPRIPEGRTHVYYQYCPYVPEPETIVKRCIRRGVDVAPMHVDVCTRMELFDWKGPEAPGADKAKVQEAADAAKAGCPISKVLKLEISLELILAA